MKTPAILTINAGSSSIKFALFKIASLAEGSASHPALSGQWSGIGNTPKLHVTDSAGATLIHQEEKSFAGLEPEDQHHQCIDRLLAWLNGHAKKWAIRAIGHRIVHGGVDYAQPIVISDDDIARLEALIPLAPLHQPHNLHPVRALRALRPDAPQVACFDTAFHRTQAPVAQTFALPRALINAGIRRYGFHGLSYEYIASQLATHLGERAKGRVIVAHLGNGASMCGLIDGKSVATSMGFTALDGLMMGTRCGAIDPGVLLYLMSEKKMSVDQLTHLLYHESGLLGVSGVSSDMRVLLESEDPHAREAAELFCYRITRELGSLAAALGGVDAIIFTGGIGEHAPQIRDMVCRSADWLGVALDDNANAAGQQIISTPESKVAVLVLRTNEEWMIARHTHRLLAQASIPAA